MTFHRTAILLAAALAAAPCRPVSAQGLDNTPPAHAAEAGKARAAAKKAAKRAKVEADRSPPLVGAAPAGEDRASSLERRRRAFFAKPDEGGVTPEGSPPRAGVTLGGRNGLTPGMSFGF